MIRKDLGIEFKTDEAASIALHIVNAEYDSDMSNTMRITTTIREVLSIIENFFGMKLDEESLHYSRLVTHLKFLVQRIFSNQMLDDGETELSLMIQKMYPHEYECSKKFSKILNTSRIVVVILIVLLISESYSAFTI